MRTPTRGALVRYVPNTPPTNPAELPRYLTDEFARMAAVTNALASPRYPPIHAAPAAPGDGDTVFADGTDWDPGSGRGLYYYDAAWVFLG